MSEAPPPGLFSVEGASDLWALLGCLGALTVLGAGLFLGWWLL